MTTARDNDFRTVQRKMVRTMLDKGRKQVAPEPLEDTSTNCSSMDAADASVGDEEVTESWIDW